MAWIRVLLLPLLSTGAAPVQDGASLVQVAAVVGRGTRPAIASFLSNDKNVCFEGPAGLAQSALATKLVAPYAAVLNLAQLRDGVACRGEGYTVPVGEDDCYPGLQVYKKWELGMLIYRFGKRMALNSYGQRYRLNNSLVELMVGCTCHSNSQLRGLMKTNCSKLEAMPASWVRKDPKTELLTCEQGHYESASRAVAVLNSLPQLPAHRTDQVHPVDCPTAGFPRNEAPAAGYDVFLSNDGQACFEAPAPIAAHALSLKQASPYNLVFDGSYVEANQRCSAKGFNHSIGRDDCYAGLFVFSKSDDAMLMYKLNKHNVMTEYSKRYKLPYSQVELMNACICHPKSKLRQQKSNECGSLVQTSASWVHEHPHKKGELACDQGPFESLTRAVVLLKNTLPEHLSLNTSRNEHMAPVPCEEHLKQRGQQLLM